MTSPFVQRNLDCAQYTQPRGSQYEGPALSRLYLCDLCNEPADESGMCPTHIAEHNQRVDQRDDR